MGTTRENIYAGFRINPVLTGLNKTNSGFTGQEFNEAFKLYNKTVIQPAQKEVIDAFEKIFGRGCMEIKPFTIKFDDLAQPNNDIKTIE
jgi:capsid portal protein